MKKVLAELHELINDFEDQGLTAEASSLQEVFIKVAQEADVEDDLANDVENILKSHSIAEVLAEIAKRVETPKNTKTMSFAFGDEPDGTEPVQRGRFPTKPTFWRKPETEPKSQQTAPVVSRESVISSYVLTAYNDKYGPNGRNAYTNLSEELAKLGYPPLSKEDFDNLVRKGLIPKKDGSFKQLQDQVVAPPVTPEILQKMEEEWKEMTERHKKMGYQAPSYG